MAKLIDLFRFSGVVGDMVGCQGSQGFYLRSRPRKTDRPPTAKQLTARAKLGMAVGFLNPFRELIYLGFAGRKANKTAAFNRASAHMIRYAVLGDYPDLTIDPAQVQLSKGSVQSLFRPALASDDGRWRLSWSQLQHSANAFADDVVYGLAYQVATGVVVAEEVIRGAGELYLDLADEPVGSEWLVYACVSDRTVKQFGNSQFLGRAIGGQ